jgi:uncharacterized protein DUF5681
MSANEKSLANLKPFQPGQSGNPKGRPPARVTKALREIAAEVGDGDEQSGAQKLARILWHAANGERKVTREQLDAMKICIDRLEGKARQPVTLTVGKVEEYERMVELMMETEACTRDEAIEALAVTRPEVADVLS